MIDGKNYADGAICIAAAPTSNLTITVSHANDTNVRNEKLEKTDANGLFGRGYDDMDMWLYKMFQYRKLPHKIFKISKA